MSIRDRDRQAKRVFGSTSEVTDAGVLRIGSDEFPLPNTRAESWRAAA